MSDPDIEKRKARGKIVKQLLLAFLVLTNIILFYTAYQFRSDKAVVDQELLVKEDRIDTLEIQLKKTEAELMEYTRLNQQINELLKKAEAQITALREEIDLLKQNPANKTELTRKYLLMQKTAENYLHRIDSLVVANRELNKLNQQLTSELSQEKKKVNRLEDEVDFWKKEAGLSAIPVANNIALNLYHMDDDGTKKQTFRVENTNLLKVNFDIDIKDGMKPGKYECLLRLVFPDGSVPNASGTFTPKGAREPIPYTSKVIIRVEKPGKISNSLFSERRESFPIGKYVVEIFYEDQEIGSYEVDLRN